MELSRELDWADKDLLLQLKDIKLSRLVAGLEVLDLSMINPDLEPERFLLDKLLEASVKPGNQRYAVSRGIKKLRRAFSVKYGQVFQSDLDPQTQVCVTMGSKNAVASALLCLKSPDKKVLVGRPVYPVYIAALNNAQIQYETFELDHDQDRMLKDIALKLESGSFNVLLLNFPNNPTGIVVSREFYTELTHLACRHDLFVLNDFVYGEMLLDGSAGISLLSEKYFQSAGAEIYSLSKAYSVPGWRVGALLGSAPLVKRVGCYKANMDYGIFLPVQIAAAAALCASQDLVSPVRREYSERLSVLCSGLRKLGWDFREPAAGCSVWAEIPENCRTDSLNFCKRLLEKEGVLLLPGSTFGERYSSFVRFAMVVSVERLHSVLERLNNF
jgi:alanine-synthesizing transaminase